MLSKPIGGYALTIHVGRIFLGKGAGLIYTFFRGRLALQAMKG